MLYVAPVVFRRYAFETRADADASKSAALSTGVELRSLNQRSQMKFSIGARAQCTSINLG